MVKIDDPTKYGIDVMAYKLINAVNMKIKFEEFDQDFIVLMTELLLLDSTTSVGMGRMVDLLKTLKLRKN